MSDTEREPTPDADGGTESDASTSDAGTKTDSEAGSEAVTEATPETGTEAEPAPKTGIETEGSTESEPVEDPEDAADIEEETELMEDERDEAAEEARKQVEQRRPTPVGESTVIAKTVVRVVTPLILLTAVALLLQGHNLPGGGFIAGVLTTAAFALLYVVYGLQYLEAELLGAFPTVDNFAIGPAIVSEYRRLFAAGLALAAGGGIVAMGFGFPFLTQTVVFLEHLPIYGELELASAFVFDFGVFLVVVGALLTIVAVVGAE